MRAAAAALTYLALAGAILLVLLRAGLLRAGLLRAGQMRGRASS